jgi:hypothetical protein
MQRIPPLPTRLRGDRPQVVQRRAQILDEILPSRHDVGRGGRRQLVLIDQNSERVHVRAVRPRAEACRLDQGRPTPDEGVRHGHVYQMRIR